MKADHRKQLEKNELASHLDRFWKGATDATGSSTIWVIVGAVVLVGVLVFAWQFYSDSSSKNRSNLWRQIEQATTVADLEAIIEANRGTSIARAAKAQVARISLTDGLAKLCSDTQREAAIANVEKARTLYEQIAKEAKDDLVLQRESLLSLGKAEESLVGIPKADNSAESRGSLDRAAEIYQDMVTKYGDSPQGKEAAARVKEIKENKPQIQRFYEELNKRYAKADLPTIVVPAPEIRTPAPSVPIDPLPGPQAPINPLPAPPKPVEPPVKPPLAPPPVKLEPAKPDPAKPPVNPVPAKPELAKPPVTPAKPEPAKPEPAKPPVTPPKPDPAKPSAPTPKPEPPK